jgi:hypothetical protein
VPDGRHPDVEDQAGASASSGSSLRQYLEGGTKTLRCSAVTLSTEMKQARSEDRHACAAVVMAPQGASPGPTKVGRRCRPSSVPSPRRGRLPTSSAERLRYTTSSPTGLVPSGTLSTPAPPHGEVPSNHTRGVAVRNPTIIAPINT